MLMSQEFEAPNLVVAALGGVVTLRDQAMLVERVRATIRLVGSVRLLIHLRQFAGWGANGAADNDTWWLRDDEGISQIAIVGPREWRLPILTMIAEPIRRVPIRYFESEAPARAWLHAKSIAASAAPHGHRPAG